MACKVALEVRDSVIGIAEGWTVRDSVVGIAEGWTVRESNPGRGREFSHPSTSTLGLTHRPKQWILIDWC